MATKKDLVEAQAFSRRRLLTAFVSGAPNGRELEPTKPMRAVVTGLLLSVLLVLGSVILGLLKPGLPAGWDDNRLVVTDSNARYVALDGTLYPVLNITSARLLISDGFETVKVSDDTIADVPRGATVGIPGAPDALPDPDALVADGWLSCVDAGGAQATILSRGTVAQAVADEEAAVERAVASGEQGPPALLVEVAGREYLVTEGRRHLVPAESRDAVLRALALGTAQARPVSGPWLSLFPPGADLGALELPGAGDPLPGDLGAPAGAVVGSIVRVTDVATPGVAAWVIDTEGRLAPLSEPALNLYRLGSGALVGADVEASSAEVAGLRAAETTIAPQDWPTELPELAPTGDVCARLTVPAPGTGDPTVQLVPTAQDVTAGPGAQVLVDGNGGALVRPVAGGAETAGWAYLVDATGTAFPLPADADVVIARLGYTMDQVVLVPQEWLGLFVTGPALTIDAARTTHSPGVAPVAETWGGGDGTGDGGAAGGSDDGSAGTSGETEETDLDEEGLLEEGGFLDETDDGASVDGPVAGAVAGDQCTPGVRRLVAERPSALALLGAEEAWQVARGAGVTVAVVDSGVAAANEHLVDAVVPGFDLVGDSLGLVDADAHGTAVAGIIAARPVEGSGLVGLAPDARILPVRVYVDDTEESVEAGLGPRDDRVAEGIRAAADAGAQIINVSLSTAANHPALAAAVAYATARGSLVVASAGNIVGDAPPSPPRYPAAYPEVLAVTAVDAYGSVSTDVEHGPHIGVVAPGQAVLATYLADGDCVLAGDAASSSYATAYVSAAAALVAGRYPDETPAQWAHRLEVTAVRPVPTERSDELGWGVVRPLAALTFVDDGSAAGPPSPVHAAPEPAAAPSPVSLSPVVDAGADMRRAAVWWLLGAGVAGVAATLVGVPTRRRRGRTRVAAATTGVGPRGSSGPGALPTK